MGVKSITIHTLIGDIIAVATEESLVLLEFSDSSELPKKLASFGSVENASNSVLHQTKIQLEEYFVGKRQKFSIPLAPTGTNFQQKSWEALTKIPYGETRSYKEQALLAGNPKAIRAIGGANNKNPIAIVIPCHRVIGSSGDLIGYAGGIERKKWLLEHEATSIEAKKLERVFGYSYILQKLTQLKLAINAL